MGGQRILVNPDLEGVKDFPPKKVHELVDFVVVTTNKKGYMHGPTLGEMNFAKTNFIASRAAGEAISSMMARNLAVLEAGPGGRVVLEGKNGSALIAVFVIPGAGTFLPWQPPEVGFVFANLETGIAVGYEATGQYLGQGAQANREGIPEEAYQIDYIVTPDLRETADVAKGLAEKGTKLRGVVALPGLSLLKKEELPDQNPVQASLISLDKAIDSALGGVGETPAEFREFLASQGPPLSEVRLFEPTISGDAVDLE